jgi:hypothetical protein
MGDIAALTQFTAGAAASPVSLMTNLYTPHNTTPASLEVINGWLDDDNLPSGRQITRHHAQRNAFMLAGEVGSNAPVDFFDDFLDTTLSRLGTSGAGADTTADFIPIPGACAAFYNPWIDTDSMVFATWNISWLSDGNAAAAVSVIRFGYRKPTNTAFTFVDSSRRVVPRTIRTEGATDRWRGGTRLQHWAGHVMLTPTVNESVGWWDVGLFIGHDVLQTRVWNRSMRYVVMRRS